MANIPFSSDIPLSVQDLRDEFDRLVDRAWHGALNTAPLDGQAWAPRRDVHERSDGYFIRLEVPGVAIEDIDVSILKNTLSVKGAKRAPQEIGEAARRIRAECRFGSFCRKCELSGPVDEDSVSASCKDGVLFIRIQKTPEAQGRSVKVNPGS